MSKGGGGKGNSGRGGGGAAAATPDQGKDSGVGVPTSSVTATTPSGVAQQVISQAGGLYRGAAYMRGLGMRPGSQQYHSSLYHGATTTAAKNAIALRGNPVHVEVESLRGKWHVELTNGRHRVEAAKLAGATKIRAEATIRRPGKPDRTWTGVVKI